MELELLPGDRGVLIRSALCDSEQRSLYLELCSAADGTAEWQLLSKFAAAEQPAAPWPLLIWRHPYTGDSNVPARPGVLDWAHSLARRAAGALRAAHCATMSLRPELRRLCQQLEELQPDAALVQLYPPGGTLGEHVDEGLTGLGVSLSLGASAAVLCGGDELTLRSGDALVADFGREPHAVRCTHGAASAPPWWRRLGEQPTTGATTFGRARCNLQLRCTAPLGGGAASCRTHVTAAQVLRALGEPRAPEKGSMCRAPIASVQPPGLLNAQSKHSLTPWPAWADEVD